MTIASPLPPMQRLVLDALTVAAGAGQPCPSNEELADLVGASTGSAPMAAVKHLERRGLIQVERFNSGRQVTIVATGHVTAYTGKREPHWRAQAPLKRAS